MTITIARLSGFCYQVFIAVNRAFSTNKSGHKAPQARRNPASDLPKTYRPVPNTRCIDVKNSRIDTAGITKLTRCDPVLLGVAPNGHINFIGHSGAHWRAAQQDFDNDVFSSFHGAVGEARA